MLVPRNIAATVVGAVAAVAAVAAMSIIPAGANPPAGTTPKRTDIVGVGAQTTEVLQNAADKAYNKAYPKSAPVYSFDAEGSLTVKPKRGCAAISRPNGANAGIQALEANVRPNNDRKDYCIDFARGSRPRASTDPASIVFVPYAIDAVTWTADRHSGTTNAPANLTTAQLHAIYSCDASTLGNGASGPVTWDEVGGTGTAAVVPVIPPSTAGTRSFFLSVIGVNTLGSCVQGQDNSVEQNEGTNAVFTGADAPNIVFPYSVAVFLAQTEHNHGAGQQGDLALRRVDSRSPTTGSGSAKTINLDFGYVRTVNTVVRNAATRPNRLKVPTYLHKLVGTGRVGSGWYCRKTGRSEIRDYGFVPFAQCGELE